jgi:hypothetical protein
MNSNQESLLQGQCPVITNSTSIAIAYEGGNVLTVNYKGLQGNLPAAYGNFITVYQTLEPEFPFDPVGIQPVASANVTGGPVGSIVLPGNYQANTAYIVGYAVGPEMHGGQQLCANVCAAAFIPAAGGANPVTAALTLALEYLGADSLICNYTVPGGLSPAKNDAWAGLWIGNYPSYTVPPQFYVPVDSNMPSGTTIFNSLVPRGALCSIALFATGWAGAGKANVQTAMACSLQFTT